MLKFRSLIGEEGHVREQKTVFAFALIVFQEGRTKGSLYNVAQVSKCNHLITP